MATRLNALEDKDDGVRFQAHTRLGLIVERAVQATEIQVESHRARPLATSLIDPPVHEKENIPWFPLRSGTPCYDEKLPTSPAAVKE
jgi:hypothetical protein